MSWKNINLYSRAIPLHDDMEEDEGRADFDEKMDANNPDNFKNVQDYEEEIVRS